MTVNTNRTELKWDERVYQIQNKFKADEFVIAFEDIQDEIYVFINKVIIMNKLDHNFSFETSDHAIKYFTHLPLEEDLTTTNEFNIFSINTSNIDMSKKEQKYYMKNYVD